LSCKDARTLLRAERLQSQAFPQELMHGSRRKFKKWKQKEAQVDIAINSHPQRTQVAFLLIPWN
jgi:hypothetical protein